MKRPRNLKPSKPDDIDLPESAQVIADVIGRELTLKLAKASKGRKIYIPVTMCAGHSSVSRGLTSVPRRGCTCKGHWISKTVGDEAALLLSKTFGSECLDLASCYYIHAFERNQRIRKEFESGAKTRLQLVEEHGLTDRAMRYILQGWNGRQSKPRGTQPPSQRR